MPDKRKQSLYFPAEILMEIHAESVRLNRSLSWILQRAWRIAQPKISSYPSIEPVREAA